MAKQLSNFKLELSEWLKGDIQILIQTFIMTRNPLLAMIYGGFLIPTHNR